MLGESSTPKARRRAGHRTGDARSLFDRSRGPAERPRRDRQGRVEGIPRRDPHGRDQRHSDSGCCPASRRADRKRTWRLLSFSPDRNQSGARRAVIEKPPLETRDGWDAEASPSRSRFLAKTRRKLAGRAQFLAGRTPDFVALTSRLPLRSLSNAPSPCREPDRSTAGFAERAIADLRDFPSGAVT